MADVIARLKVDSKEYDRKIKGAKQQLTGLQQAAQTGGEALKGLAGSFGVATTAAALLSAAIVDNIRDATEFEKSMSSLQSLTGMASGEMGFFKDAAIELGSTTTQSASQVAEAFKLIGSQKPELLQNRDALKQVTKEAITLAEAAGMQVPEAATALTTALNQFGASAKSAKEYINILAAASQQGSGDINYLNTAIVNVGATAKTVGLSFSTTVAAIEAVAKAGIDASTAGTGLRNVLLALEKQQNGNFKPSVVGISKALQNLKDANLSATDSMELFGRGNVAVANALIDNSDLFDKLNGSIVGTNTAYEQAKVNNDNLDGSLQNLSSAWEGLNLTINASNSLIRPFVDNLTEVLNGSREIIVAFKNVEDSIMSPEMADKANQLVKNLIYPIEQYKPYLEGLMQIVRNYNKEASDMAARAELKAKVTEGNRGWQNGITGVMEQVHADMEQPTVAVNADVSGAVQSIETQKQKIKELTELWEQAGTQGLRDKYKREIDAANLELDRMTGKLAENAQRLADARKARTASLAAKEKKEESSFSLGEITPEGSLTPAYQEGSLNALNEELRAATDLMNSLTAGTEDFANALEWVKAVQGKIDLAESGMTATNTAKDAAKSWNSAAMAISTASNAMAGFETPAANIASIIAQAVATVIAAYSQNLAGDKTTKGNIWAFIAAAAASTVSMATTVAAIRKNAAGSFAEGGIVPGNYNGGRDSTYIYASPGEVILNRAQQQNIASQLQGSGLGGMQLAMELKGEDIRIALQRNDMRRGRS